MSSSFKTLGVVLARAGSTGLPDKHIRPLLGKPVIDYTLEHARASRLLTYTVVSSDCEKVLERAVRMDFDTIARPAKLATADASVQDVLLHALETIEEGNPFEADAVVVLYGNVPVRPEGIIDSAIELLKTTGCDSVRSFCPVGKWHPRWMSRLEGDRAAALHEGSVHRRQDLEPLFLHDGAVVVSSRKALLGALDRRLDPHAFFGEDRRGVRTNAGETVEIDAPADLFLAEAMLRHRKSTQPMMRRAS